ncbi:hypothetical protein Pelo_18965 [Pelomyxa schiedti]|nr:hypothetical protein Pelo_18965 [Pelomyxa schiedti]
MGDSRLGGIHFLPVGSRDTFFKPCLPLISPLVTQPPGTVPADLSVAVLVALLAPALALMESGGRFQLLSVDAGRGLG